MKIVLIVVGRTIAKNMQMLLNDYIERVNHYLSFSVEVIPELKMTKNLTEFQQKEKEGECIIKYIKSGDYVVLLDEHGKEMRSVDFADWIQKKQNCSIKRLVFVIGGPYGFSSNIYKMANDKISLSCMTFSHQMVRLIFIEQLYRAMTILNHEPYHHE